MSLLSELKTDLAAAIEALPATDDWPVFAQWMPELDRESLTKGIYISPESCATVLISRTCKQHELKALVVIIDPLAQSTEDAQADANDDVAQAIADGILGVKVGGALCTQTEQITAASVDHWRQLRTHASLLRLTFKR